MAVLAAVREIRSVARPLRDWSAYQTGDAVADRDKYRDNDDMRGGVGGDNESKPDTKGEARGDARESVGNNARGTDANPTGPKGNDGQKQRSDRPDEFDRDLRKTELRGQQYVDGEITES
jgi:hypothetical protein